jgi:RNA polymerase sigma-70 factor (ECF subfamily)
MAKREFRRQTFDCDGKTLEQLISSISAGDIAAFEQLRHSCRPLLFGIAHQYLRSRADADEVVCDVYTRLWFQSHRFDPLKGSASAWMATLCRNAAIDFLRRFHRRELCLPVEIWPDEPMSPELIVERWQMQRLLFAAIAQLPVLQQRMMLLTFRDGLSQRQISRAHKVPLGTVKSHINRSLKRLRREVGIDWNNAAT